MDFWLRKGILHKTAFSMKVQTFSRNPDLSVRLWAIRKGESWRKWIDKDRCRRQRDMHRTGKMLMNRNTRRFGFRSFTNLLTIRCYFLGRSKYFNGWTAASEKQKTKNGWGIVRTIFLYFDNDQFCSVIVKTNISQLELRLAKGEVKSNQITRN